MGWQQRDGDQVYVPDYRIKPRDDGFEPQMSYQIGGAEVWLPLNGDGYVLEPEVWRTFDATNITKHLVLTHDLAQRALTCARRINGERLISNVSPEEGEPR